MSEEHILELNHRYLLKISDGGFVLYQLELTPSGTWVRSKSVFCTTANGLFDRLLALEWDNEEIKTLEEMKKNLEAIKVEFREAIVVGRSQ